MCARIIHLKLAGSHSRREDVQSSPVCVNSLEAQYRVLRSGRQRPWRSVNRETIGRNAERRESVELRHILNRVWVPSFYVQSEGNTSVAENANKTHRSPSEQHVVKVWERNLGSPAKMSRRNTKVAAQEVILKSIRRTHLLDVRWPHSSEEVQ